MDYQPNTIHAASLNGDFTKVQSLLHEDSKLANAVDDDGRTPLHWCCVSGSLETFNFLMSLKNEHTSTFQQFESLDTEDGFGSYYININTTDQGGWVRSCSCCQICH